MCFLFCFCLVTICSCDSLALLALLLILSTYIVSFQSIWYLYVPVVWEFMATVTRQLPYADCSTALRTYLPSGE